MHDNPALHAALQHGGDVVPLFVLDPALLEGRQHGRAEHRKAFLFAGLGALDVLLRARGSRLVVRRGKPSEVVPAVAKEAGADAVFAAEDYSPYAHQRDRSVASAIRLSLTEGTAIRRPQEVVTANRAPFLVFTAFARAWRAGPPLESGLLPEPSTLPSVPHDIWTEGAPLADSPADFPAGESEALRRLQAFTEGRSAALHDYDKARDRLNGQATSQLSPYLRFGMLSPRMAAVRAEQSGTGASRWLTELIWRDFYLSILYHFPHVLEEEYESALKGIRWRNNDEEIEAWKAGMTGYPVVDAAMRQLSATGWIPNRARMIVASFLVKHLLVDWRIGEAWFMQQLVDGDPAANNGGWQWTAGVGTDAAPYFRVFNPILQAKRFDPEGDFVRRWVPELASVPSQFLHEPWRMPGSMQAERSVEIGRTYPAPIVGLPEGRQRAIEAFREARERSS